MMAMRLGIVGIGSMGRLHARVVAGHKAANLVWVSDPDEEAGRGVADRFDTKWQPEPTFADVDALIVAAPTEFHADVANEVIRAGKPMLLEKPLAPSLADSTKIVDQARAAGTVLACGFVERFNPAVRTAMEIVKEPVRVATMRHSPYSNRIRTGVASDLLIHDIDMVLRIVGTKPSVVQGRFGHFHRNGAGATEDVVEALMQFPEGQVATASASRLSQMKLRSLSINELRRQIDVDLVRQSITVYRNVDGGSFDEDAGYSQQTIIDVPVIRHVGEPLQLQLEHFLCLIHDDALAEVELETLIGPHAVVDSVSASARSVRV
ncbi:MAG TPA: Gfo/Idh/MocA family oxidoreductase [Ilumatobacter sp.]|nr:Gfo/Idh/MocA family oxidoreductase [Ilumatobacter sp.]